MTDMYLRISIFFSVNLLRYTLEKIMNASVHSSILRMDCLDIFGLDSMQPFSLMCKVPPEQSSGSSMLPFKSIARLVYCWLNIFSIICFGRWRVRSSSPHLKGSISCISPAKSLKMLSKWMIPSGLSWLIPIPELSTWVWPFKEMVSTTSWSCSACWAAFFCFFWLSPLSLASACLLLLLILGASFLVWPLPDIFRWWKISRIFLLRFSAACLSLKCRQEKEAGKNCSQLSTWQWHWLTGGENQLAIQLVRLINNWGN